MRILLPSNTIASERGNWLQMTEEINGMNLVICLNLCQIEAKKDDIKTISSFPFHPPISTGFFQLCLLWHLKKTCWCYEEKPCTEEKLISPSLPSSDRNTEKGTLSKQERCFGSLNSPEEERSFSLLMTNRAYISWPKCQAQWPGKAAWMLPAMLSELGHRIVWGGKDLKIPFSSTPPGPAMYRDATHQIRLLRAPPDLVLNTLRNGASTLSGLVWTTFSSAPLSSE